MTLSSIFPVILLVLVILATFWVLLRLSKGAQELKERLESLLDHGLLLDQLQDQLLTAAEENNLKAIEDIQRQLADPKFGVDFCQIHEDWRIRFLKFRQQTNEIQKLVANRLIH